MELILWRHAEAEDGIGDDMARALTRRGHKQAKLMAAWLKPRLGKDWTLLVSPARRALQTADALGREYEVSDRVDTLATSEGVLRETGWPDAGGNVMVVGHQPTLGEVAAELLGSTHGIAFRKGAIWWFATRERDGSEVVLKAVLNPELLED